MSADLHDQARTHNYLPGLSAWVGVSVRGFWYSQIERWGWREGERGGGEKEGERGGWREGERGGVEGGRGGGREGRERGGGTETERETHRYRQKQTDRQTETQRERGCEPAWPSDKMLLLVRRRTSRFDSTSALLYLKKLQSMDTVL